MIVTHEKIMISPWETKIVIKEVVGCFLEDPFIDLGGKELSIFIMIIFNDLFYFQGQGLSVCTTFIQMPLRSEKAVSSPKMESKRLWNSQCSC